VPSPPADPPYSSSGEAGLGAVPGDPSLRIALTLPGGITPGTFEAGAVSGLLAWTQEVNNRQANAVVVDVIAGASAGALTALLAARVLLAGDDPVAAFRQAWVAAPSLRALRGRGRSAPLSLRRARTVAHSVLFAPLGAEPRPPQTAPVSLDIALGCLRGLSQEIPAEEGSAGNRRRLTTTSYLDWSTYKLSDPPTSSNTNAEQWTDAINSVIASASHPLFFRAHSLDREPLRENYTAQGIINLPAGDDTLRLWYTDGGLVDNEPLGRCLDHVADIDRTAKSARLVMLLRSNMRRPPSSESPAWAGEGRPLWTQTLARVLGLVASHSADQDLVEVEKVNARLGWTKDVAAKVAELVGERADARASLEQLLGTIDRERAALAPITRPEPAADDGSLTKLIESVLQSASGLAGKVVTDVAVFMPDPEFPGPQPMDGLLGFIQRKEREEHFAAGYWSMLKWIEHAPTFAARLPAELIADAGAAAAGEVRRPRASRGGRYRSRRISFETRAELLRVGARALRIAAADLGDFFDRRDSRQRRPLVRRHRRYR
jgi:predicted acylesterase/phospholipase RssA